MKPRPVRLLAALSSALLTVTLLTASGSTAVTSRAAPKPGVAGSVVTLDNAVDLKGYDIGIGPDGTAYVGWIAGDVGMANREVHLCRIPKGATSCAGGIQSTPSLGPASAAGLRVVVTGNGAVTLVWYYETGIDDGRIATSTVSGGVLSAAANVADAPDSGELLDAVAGPGNTVWAVIADAPGGTHPITILPGLTNPAQTATAPFMVGTARLAFSGSQAVLVIDQYGQIGDPVRVARRTGTGWTGFTAVPRTWTVGGAFDVATSTTGVRLVAPVNNASYQPRIGAWLGGSFGPLAPTGDRNACHPTSHDLFADASGRLSDVAIECDQVTVANHPKAGRAAFVRFAVGGTPAGGQPQIGSLPRGLAWVAWSRLAGASGHRLLLAQVRLPALSSRKAKKVAAGKAILTGPVSCLPPVGTRIAVKGNPARGWRVASKTLLVDGKRRAKLNGAALAAGSTHRLKGKVTFAKGGQRKTVVVKRAFRACSNP